MAVGPPRAAHPVAPWSEVLGLFGLPPLLHPPITVIGGWTQGVWRVETLDGSYAIKEMAIPPGDWWIEQLDGAIAFELAAWRSGRIFMAEPVQAAGTDQLLRRVQVGVSSLGYRCHRWVDGEPCHGLVPDVERSRRVGMIVAELARLDIHKGTTADQLPWNAIDAYERTVEEASDKGMEWAKSLNDLRPYVETLRHEFAELVAKAVPTAVMHRDLDPKNALSGIQGEIVLLDWDYAGPRLLVSELLDAALSFAGGPVYAEEACVLATIQGYVESGGPPVFWSLAAPPLVEEGFRWIMLNAWRCLGHRNLSADQRAFACQLLRSLIREWPEQIAAMRAWALRLGAFG